ncbi:FliM/FliN family flagellar motor switch protein [Pseudomonas chlororaphis]|uniref:FliM/FliN family flagellar motor switch protein n=1 Tax=Pseudomonas chlororaphis TaxID=587753 RepID=UPI0030CFC408
MKKDLVLRRVASTDYERRHAVARWRRDGHSVRLAERVPQNHYIMFWAQGCGGLWQGMVDAQQWLHAVWPQCAQLLPEGVGSQDVLELFSAVSRPLEIMSDVLDYQRLFDVELVCGESLPEALVPCIPTSTGEVWVMSLPKQRSALARPLQPWLLAIPQTLRVVLGNSELPPLSCSQLMPGDVLFIAEQTQHLVMADQCIGRFSFTEEGLHMELTPSVGTAATKPDTLSQLPVKLEFVLGELTLSMSQLNDFIELQLLPLETIATHQVEVRVQGQCIATGELVRTEDRLGVELSKIFRGTSSE